MSTHTSNLYSRYLASTWADRIVDQAGAKITYANSYNLGILTAEAKESNRERFFGEHRWYYADVIVSVVPTGDVRYDDLPQAREEIADALLTAQPSLQLFREDGNIYLFAEAHGSNVCFELGQGVCEKVVVGYRDVPAKPAHSEPIYEVRCIDPLAGLQTAEVSA